MISSATLARERIAPRAAEIDESHEFPWDVVELFRENEPLRALLRRGVRRHRHRDAADARRDRGGLEGLRDERADPRGAGARLARAQARGRRTSRRQRYLPRLASGEWLARVRAHRGRVRLGLGGDAHRRRGATATSTSSTASKRFITNAGVAHALHRSSRRPTPKPATPASRRSSSRRTRRASRSRGSSRRWGSRARRPASSCFDDCRVPAENLLGEEGEGFQIAMRDPRPLAAGHRGAGARPRAGRDRLRARVREDAGDDGQADRAAPAGRRRCSRTWRRSARRRAGSCTRFGAAGRRGRRRGRS